MRPSNKDVEMEAFEASSSRATEEDEAETPLQEGNNNSDHKRRKRTESRGRKKPILEKRKLRDQTTTATPTMLSKRVEQDEVKNKLRPDVMARDHRHREMCSRQQQEATTLRWVKRQSATKRALTLEERKQVKANATKEKEEEEGKQPPEPDKHNKEKQNNNSLLDLDPLLLLDFKWWIDWWIDWLREGL